MRKGHSLIKGTETGTREKLGLQKEKHSNRGAEDELETELGHTGCGVQVSLSGTREPLKAVIRGALLQEDERGHRRRRQGGLDREELEAWCLCFLKGTVSHQREPA